MEKFILDTNLFFNMEAGFDMGGKTTEVIENIISYSEKLKNKAEFLMPPAILDEFLSFFEDKNIPEIKKLLSCIVVRSPTRGAQAFSSTVFYKLVEDIRQRSYKGLNLGEEEIKKAGAEMMGKEIIGKKEFEIKIGKIITNFRDRYRQATRNGFIDSVADLDLIVLAKETNGFLVSSDQGVIYWGRIFGVKEVPPQSLRSRLDSLLGHHPE